MARYQFLLLGGTPLGSIVYGVVSSQIGHVAAAASFGTAAALFSAWALSRLSQRRQSAHSP